MLHLGMRFILLKLEDTELNFELESKEVADFIQGSLGAFMEEVVFWTVFTKDKKKESSGEIIKEVRDYANTVLKIVTEWMSASTYFRGITQLLDHADSVVKRKRGIDSDSSVKIAAISALETLAKEYPSNNPTYSNCLATIINHIGFDDAVTSVSIHTAGALINVLGSKALPQLPNNHEKYNAGVTSVLTTIEVIVEKLGEFVDPYLEILDLVVLHPECGSHIDAKLDVKAADVQNLLAEKAPVRLILPPLLNMHSVAAKCGEASLLLAFQMQI